jgi:DNA-binding MarR family transcriptional regulator
MSPANRMVDDRRRILFLMSDTLRLLRADFAGRVPGYALTPALSRLLLYLQRYPGCRQVEIADWLEITPVTVGRMLDRLEKRGLVRRESDPDDRRVFRVHLDDSARPHMARLDALVERTGEQAFRGLSLQERAALLSALERVHDNLIAGGASSRRVKGAGHDR